MKAFFLPGPTASHLLVTNKFGGNGGMNNVWQIDASSVPLLLLPLPFHFYCGGGIPTISREKRKEEFQQIFPTKKL
jgi:hypothetical protein